MRDDVFYTRRGHDRFTIQDIAGHDLHIVGGCQVFAHAARKVIENRYRMTGGEQIVDDVRTDEAGSAGYEYRFGGRHWCLRRKVVVWELVWDGEVY